MGMLLMFFSPLHLVLVYNKKKKQTSKQTNKILPMAYGGIVFNTPATMSRVRKEFLFCI